MVGEKVDIKRGSLLRLAPRLVKSEDTDGFLGIVIPGVFQRAGLNTPRDSFWIKKQYQRPLFKGLYSVLAVIAHLDPCHDSAKPI
jgi:hypothetical protein